MASAPRLGRALLASLIFVPHAIVGSLRFNNCFYIPVYHSFTVCSLKKAKHERISTLTVPQIREVKSAFGSALIDMIVRRSQARSEVI